VLRDQVRRLADTGTSVLLVEQKAFEALGVSDWAYILVAGRVELAGPAGEILARPDIRAVFLGQSARDAPARPPRRRSQGPAAASMRIDCYDRVPRRPVRRFAAPGRNGRA
jgi:ABC-type sugar transport system ATPase subunit